jgi:hypothetical protein
MDSYIEQAKNLRGNDLVELILKVFADKHIFTFADLLEIPSVIEVL